MASNLFLLLPGENSPPCGTEENYRERTKQLCTRRVIFFTQMLIDFFAAPWLDVIPRGQEVARLSQESRLIDAGEQAAQAARTDDVPGDAGRLLLAAIQVMQGRYEDGLDLVSRVLPYLPFERAGSAYTHLVGAAALHGLARQAEAAHWCSVALEQAASPSARWLRAPVLGLWAEVSQHLGQGPQARTRARNALRAAEDPRALLHAHLSTARVWRAVDGPRAQYHQVLAAGLAETPRQRHLAGLAATTDAAVPTEASRTPVTLRLLQGTSLTVGGVQVSAARSPRAVLLLAFLIQNDGEALEEIAAQILPPDTEVKDADLSQAHRVARVRQHLRQARALLGDDAAVVSQKGRLYLGQQYTWESDLRLAVTTGTFDARRLLPTLACPWLDEIRFTAARVS